MLKNLKKLQVNYREKKMNIMCMIGTIKENLKHIQVIHLKEMSIITIL